MYEEVKTPFKYGIILRPGEHESIDCPNVFRFGDKWYMVYIAIKDKVGYETFLAESKDLLHWKTLGKILPFAERWLGPMAGCRRRCAADPAWGGTGEVQSYDGKYWMSYIGGAKARVRNRSVVDGNSMDRKRPIGRFLGLELLRIRFWLRTSRTRGSFEKATLYKSNILWDKAASFGYPFVMFYNAKQQGPAIERIGMAVSKDMVHWSRYGNDPVIDNRKGISGDPQIVRIGDLWVMFYFGAGWKRGAFDTFACSHDLVNWTKWDGADLISPSEPWDKTFAHKPWVLKHEGVVYHFYCAVGRRAARSLWPLQRKAAESQADQPVKISFEIICA